MRTLRFLLLAIASFGIGAACFFEAWNSIQTGVASIPLRRSVALFTFARDKNLVGFGTAVALFTVIGIVVCAAACWQLRAVLHRRDPLSEKLISEAIARVEKAAPSGLTPLWVGLSIAIICFVMYAVA